MAYRRILIILVLAFVLVPGQEAFPAPAQELRNEDIVIVEGSDRTIYEYRQNGLLMMIKVVPNRGKAYYMVPADGSPHFSDLQHREKLYPQWRIIEW